MNSICLELSWKESCTVRQSRWHAPQPPLVWKVVSAYTHQGSITPRHYALYKLTTIAIWSYSHIYQTRIAWRKEGEVALHYNMSNKISDVPATMITKSLRDRRPLPKRGQIKSRIAANAFHSIVSVFSRAFSDHQHSSRKIYMRKNWKYWSMLDTVWSMIIISLM